MIIKQCLECKKEFYVYTSKERKNKVKFCTNRCYGYFMKGKKKFISPDALQKLKDRMKGNNFAKNRIFYKHSPETIEKIRQSNLGKKHIISEQGLIRMKIKNYEVWNKNKKKCFSEETRKKMSLSALGKRMGIKNGSWKGGKTNLGNKIKRLTEYKNWGKMIFYRDKFCCRNCKEIGGKLSAHHLKSFAYLIHWNSVKNIKSAILCKDLWDLNNGVTLCTKCHKNTSNYSFKAVKNPIDSTIY